MTENDPTRRDDSGGWAGPESSQGPQQANQGPQQQHGYPEQPRSPWAPEGQTGSYGVGQAPEQIPGKTSGPFPGQQYEHGHGQWYGRPQEQNPYGPLGGQTYPYQQGTGAQQGNVAPAFPTPPPVGGQGKQRKGGNMLIVGVAVLALVAGGTAGGVGGYFAGGLDDGGAGSSMLAPPPPAKDTSQAQKGSVEWVVDQVMPSVVQVRVATGRGVAGGSGFILTPDGHILTNNHVVAGAAQGGKIEVQLQDGRRAEATIVGRDPTTDIAVIKVDGFDNLNPLETGRSANLQVGQNVVAIGSPYRLSGTVTEGIVSSLHRPVRAGGGQGGLATVMDAIQTDAAINPGNSGGPLVNMRGQVIGINSAIYSPGSGATGGSGGNVGIGFAIPIDQARRTAEQIMNKGYATQTYIGATVRNAEGGGVLLVEVMSGTPAEEAGLESGDVVTKIGDRRTDDKNALIAAIRTKAPGKQVTLTLKDGSKVDVTLGGKPVKTN